jgi:hypothetical protein
VTSRLKFGAVIWFRAWRGKGSRTVPRERGVKNLRNLRGVIEGGRCSFLSFRELLRGERFEVSDGKGISWDACRAEMSPKLGEDILAVN